MKTPGKPKKEWTSKPRRKTTSTKRDKYNKALGKYIKQKSIENEKALDEYVEIILYEKSEKKRIRTTRAECHSRPKNSGVMASFRASGICHLRVRARARRPIFHRRFLPKILKPENPFRTPAGREPRSTRPRRMGRLFCATDSNASKNGATRISRSTACTSALRATISMSTASQRENLYGPPSSTTPIKLSSKAIATD